MAGKEKKIENNLFVRWGIIGCSKISSDFCMAMQLCRENKVVAVASRSRERSEQFAVKFDIPRFYDSYEALLADAEVDIVYVGANTSEHYSFCLKILQANKALLCEKPLSMSLVQCRRLASEARIRRRLMVEGLWSRFLPTYDHLRRLLLNGEIGEVKEVSVEMCFKFENESSNMNKQVGGGMTLSLACYAFHLVELVFRETPKRVEAKADLDESGVDMEVNIHLEWEDGRCACIKVSGLEEAGKDALITGTNGSIRLKEFWKCEELEVNGKPIKYPFPVLLTKTRYPGTVGFLHEIERVGEAWRRGLLEVGEVPHEASEWVYELTEKVLHLIGISYPSSLTNA